MDNHEREDSRRGPDWLGVAVYSTVAVLALWGSLEFWKSYHEHTDYRKAIGVTTEAMSMPSLEDRIDKIKVTELKSGSLVVSFKKFTQDELYGLGRYPEISAAWYEPWVKRGFWKDKYGDYQYEYFLSDRKNGNIPPLVYIIITREFGDEIVTSFCTRNEAGEQVAIKNFSAKKTEPLVYDEYSHFKMTYAAFEALLSDHYGRLCDRR